jgi:dTDP-4-amino-4,6-dideoxygalactose transaminase
MRVIEKKPSNADAFVRPYFFYDRARDAFSAFLKAARFKKGQTVLLPAYIGWSSREGSGVFDPVLKLGLNYAFYKLTDKAEIDLRHLTAAFKSGDVRVFVLIHYFGYVDKNYEKAAAIAREHGALILEDEAHSMLTDLVGGRSGRLGDACIYSLHKMLPLKSGGLLVFNGPDRALLRRLGPEKRAAGVHPWKFDLRAIAEKRVRNFRTLSRLLRPLKDIVAPLRKSLRPGEIPQTYPVIVQNGLRDRLYFSLNKAGYGAVSLYHDLIPQLNRARYPAAYELAGHILNLPLHQDADERSLTLMVSELRRILRDNKA